MLFLFVLTSSPGLFVMSHLCPISKLFTSVFVLLHCTLFPARSSLNFHKSSQPISCLIMCVSVYVCVVGGWGHTHTISSATIAETNQLIYITAAVILEVLGYKMNSNKEYCSILHGKEDYKLRSRQHSGKLASYQSFKKYDQERSTTGCP